jgi:hypothetical protein
MRPGSSSNLWSGDERRGTGLPAASVGVIVRALQDLSHLHLTVGDLARSKDFHAKCFGFREQQVYKGTLFLLRVPRSAKALVELDFVVAFQCEDPDGCTIEVSWERDRVGACSGRRRRGLASPQEWPGSLAAGSTERLLSRSRARVGNGS